MIKTFTGANSFLQQQVLQQIVDVFLEEHSDMGLQRIDGEEAEYDKIREAVESLPFLATKKLVILRAPSANKMFVEQVEKLLPEVDESIDVVIIEPKLDKRLSYYKWLKKNTDFKEYNELDESGLRRWLAERAKSFGATISSSDAHYLIERVGANQQLLSNEIAKLSAYSDKVDRNSIDLLTDPNPQSTVFELLDAAFAGNHQRMLKLYQEQRASKVEPQQIIAMLAWQLHILAVIKTAGNKSDDQIASDAKINPYVLRKSRAISNKLSADKLRQLVGELTDLDLKLKSVAIDADDALQAYLLNI